VAAASAFAQKESVVALLELDVASRVEAKLTSKLDRNRHLPFLSDTDVGILPSIFVLLQGFDSEQMFV